MLHFFSIDNYRSFGARQEVSFVAPPPPPGDSRFTDPGESVHGLSLSKALAVIGSNGAGKTSVLRALHFLYYFIGASALDNPGELLPFAPFLYQRERRATHMTIAVESRGEVYAYEMALSRETVLLEQLIRVEKDGSQRSIFHRALEGGSYAVATPGLSEDGRRCALAAGRRVSAASSILAGSPSDELSGVEGFFRCFANWQHSLHDACLFDPLEELKDAFEDEPGLARRVVDLARSFGLRLGEVEYHTSSAKKYLILLERLEALRRRNKDHDRPGSDLANLERALRLAKQGRARRIVCSHTLDGRQYGMSLSQESSGTRRLLVLLLRVLKALDAGGLVVQDFIENDLHPDMLTQVLRLFFDKKTNPLNAQLLCTTYSPLVPNLLHPSQVLLAVKDESLSTRLVRPGQG